MADALRILVVDDERDYAQLVVRFLQLSAAWPETQFSIETTFDGGLKALETNSFDVAFVDYRLGIRDGLQLLSATRDAQIDTSNVVMTGQGDEEVAVKAMRAGAADYLSKLLISRDTLDRTIHHAVALRDQERQRRAAERALRENEERFRALVENSSDALLLLDSEARVTYLSASTARQLGWSSDEMVGHSIFDFMHPDDRELVGGRMAQVLRKPGERVTQDVRFRHKDGTWHVME